MKTMFDTSVLVAAMISTHQHHDIAASWLQRAHAGEFPWFVAAHSLAECYATLTAPARSLGFPPSLVAQIIRENLTERNATIIDLTATDYQTTIERVAGLGLVSGMIYDALLTTAAEKAGIERLFTFNVKHFLRAWPAGSQMIMAPS
jgi:predicted nucleic acid-binding protein